MDALLVLKFIELSKTVEDVLSGEIKNEFLDLVNCRQFQKKIPQAGMILCCAYEKIARRRLCVV